jgi:hypothetical protein
MNIVAAQDDTETVQQCMRVFENSLLNRILGPKKDEVARCWRKIHNEKLHNSYSSTNMITVIKSSRFTWAGNVGSIFFLFPS